MKQTITLYADEGMILTDGKNYGTIIYLAEGITPDNIKEITLEEYNKIIKEDNIEI